jgi:hypothetical protein
MIKRCAKTQPSTRSNCSAYERVATPMSPTPDRDTQNPISRERLVAVSGVDYERIVVHRYKLPPIRFGIRQYNSGFTVPT